MKQLRKADDVDTYDFELGSDFEDEDLDSDDEEIVGKTAASKIKKAKEDGSDDDMAELDDMLLAGSGSDGETGDEGEDDDLDDISGDEHDLNEETHTKLMSKVAKMAGAKARREQVTEGAEGEFALGNTQEGEVSLGDLMGSFSDMPGESGLKKKLSKLEKKAPMAAPLSKRSKEKVDREAAYAKSSKDVTKWQGQVQKERQAEQLVLADEATPRIVSSASLAANHRAETPLEKQVQEALAAAGMDEASIAKYEELELKKCSVEEVQARQKELAKMRSLMLASEVKAKRAKKIKSKKYHKVARKEAEKKEAAQLELLKVSDPAAYREKVLQMERRQAEERMTQKHKNTGKWVSRQLKRGVGNANVATRQAITEQLKLGEELKKKQMSTDDFDEDDEISGEEGDEEDYGAAGSLWNSKQEKDDELKKGIHGLKFMQRGRQKAAESAQALLEEMSGLGPSGEDTKATEMAGRKSFTTQAANGKRKKNVTPEEEEAMNKKLRVPDTGLQIGPDSVSTRMAGRVAVDKGKASERFDVGVWEAPTRSSAGRLNQKETDKYGRDPEQDDADADAPSQKRVRRSPRLGGASAPSPVANNGSKANPWLERVSDRSRAGANQGAGAELEVDAVMKPSGSRFAIAEEAQEALVKSAFAGEDTEAAFVADKSNLIERDLPDIPDDGDMAGWGTWTGEGTVAPEVNEAKEREKEKKRKRILKEETQKRADAKLDKVIINEKRDKKGAKYLAKSLPHGFGTAAQYERSIRQPVGKEWNTDRTHVQMTKKEVVSRRGQVIQPAKLNASAARGKFKG